MGATRGAATQRLEHLQGRESERSGEEDPTNLEANILRSLKNGTNIERRTSDLLDILKLFEFSVSVAGSMVKPRDNE